MLSKIFVPFNLHSATGEWVSSQFLSRIQTDIIHIEVFEYHMNIVDKKKMKGKLEGIIENE